MTTEEAIEYWEGLRKTFSSQLEKEENYFGRMHLQTTIDVLDTTISALRQQGVTDKDVGHNEPLTLDELREMDGEPVWIVWPDGRIESKWWIVGNYDWHVMEFDDHRYDYGKTWVAYRQKPEEVQK